MSKCNMVELFRTEKERADYYENEYLRAKMVRAEMIAQFSKALDWNPRRFSWNALFEILKAAAAESLPSPELHKALCAGREKDAPGQEGLFKQDGKN